MDKPKIIFFVNGNLNIGYGHIARTLVLEKEFSSQGYETIFVIPDNFLFENHLVNNKISYFFINSFKDKKKVFELLNEIEGQKICVVDCIEEEYKALIYLSDIPNVFIVTITLFLFNINNRYEDISFFPEYAIDTCKQLKNTKGTMYSLYSGKSYFMFRKEFETQNKTIPKNATRLLITMGGTDPCNFTLQVLKAIKSFSNKEIVVILSKKSAKFSQVEAICAKNSKISLYDYVDNIADYMRESDIVLLNGGNTRYEVCLTKTPFIAISIHKKQYNITKSLTDKIEAINLGVGKHLTDEQINNAVEELLDNYVLRTTISKKMGAEFDVNGSKRVVGAIIENYKKRIYENNG